MQLSDLKVGDVAYVLNGHQTNSFVAEVVAVDAEGIEVALKDKSDRQWFWKEDGAPDVEEEDGRVPDSRLVPPDDWRVRVLNIRRLFRTHLNAVTDATSAFRKDPTSENSLRLHVAVQEWTQFTATADPFAVRATSIAEYKKISTQI